MEQHPDRLTKHSHSTRPGESENRSLAYKGDFSVCVVVCTGSVDLPDVASSVDRLPLVPELRGRWVVATDRPEIADAYPGRSYRITERDNVRTPVEAAALVARYVAEATDCRIVVITPNWPMLDPPAVSQLIRLGHPATVPGCSLWIASAGELRRSRQTGQPVAFRDFDAGPVWTDLITAEDRQRFEASIRARQEPIIKW